MVLGENRGMIRMRFSVICARPFLARARIVALEQPTLVQVSDRVGREPSLLDRNSSTSACLDEWPN